MSEITYTNFIIEFSKGTGAYQVSFESPVSGEVVSSFQLPFEPLELENFLLKLGFTTSRAVRSATSPELAAAKEFGKKLFDALFHGEARGALKSTLDDAAQHPDRGVRLELRFRDTPELAALPWEFLYRPSNDTFFALSADTPILRYVELPEPGRAYPVKLPLHMLAMVSAPTDYPALDVEHEKSKLMDAFRQSKHGDLIASGIVQVDWLENGTLAALRSKLGAAHYHIFHYIGHGGVEDGEGVLILEHESKRGRAVSGSAIGQILRDERSLHLVVLNACEGATMPGPNEFATTALALIRQGMPAVIAMQFVITDEAAKVFAGELFRSVLDGNTLDVALTDARRAIFAGNLGTEWATPVLYTRARGKRIFDIDASNVVPVPAQKPAPTVPTSAGWTTRIQETFKQHPLWFYAGGAALVLLIVALIAVVLGRGQPPTVAGLITPALATATPPALATATTLQPLTVVAQGRLLFGYVLDTPGKPREWGVLSFDLQTKTQLRIPIDMTRLDPGGFVNAFAVSRDGQRIAFSAVVPGSKFRVAAMNLDGTGLTRVEQDDGPYTDEIPRWSPDGTQLAFSSSLNGAPDSQEVYVMDSNGKNRKRLTFSSADSRYPDWSPDGTKLVYTEGTQSNHDLHQVSVPDQKSEPLVSDAKWNEIEPVWSPRGDKIAYTARNDINTIHQIRVLDLASRRIVVLPCPTDFCYAPVWSPDGSLVAFIATTRADGGGEPYFTDPSGNFAYARFAPGIELSNRILWALGTHIPLATPTPTHTPSPTPTSTETPTFTPTATRAAP